MRILDRVSKDRRTVLVGAGAAEHGLEPLSVEDIIAENQGD